MFSSRESSKSLLVFLDKESFMETRLENTAGLGRRAEVWVDEQLLVVCDGISVRGQRRPPGLLGDVRFTYVSEEGFRWEDACLGNPGRKKSLAPVREWSYIGYGQVVSIMPVVIDFGVLKMEDANWTNDNRLVGRFVQVKIDRLEISPEIVRDWPENAK